MKFRTPHPGAYIREDMLPALGMTITDLAAHLGITRQALSDLVNEKRPVNIDMACRLGAAVGNGPRFWLRLQMEHDLWEAEQRGEMKVKPLRKPPQQRRRPEQS